MRKIAIKILIIFLIFGIFFLLKGTLNNEKKVEIKKTLGNFDYKLMSQNIDRYKLDEGKYSVLPFECEDDIYATYYLALIRQKLMEESFEIAYNYSDLNHDFISLYDLYYVCDLFSAKNIRGISKSELYDLFLSYQIDGKFVVDKRDQIADRDKEILFTLVYVAKCADLLEVDASEIIHESDIEWLNSYEKTLLNKQSDEILDYMGKAYQVLIVNNSIGNSSDELIECVRKHYIEYVDALRKSIESMEEEVVFSFEAYWYLTDYIGEKDLLQDVEWKEFLSLLENPNGGYSLPGSDPNPLIIYIIVELSYRYDLNLLFDDVLNIVQRHETINHSYIPFILFEEEMESTFYAKKIHGMLNEAETEIDVYDEVSLYSIAAGRGELSADEKQYMDSFILSVIESEDDIGYSQLSILTQLCDRMENMDNDEQLKNKLKETIDTLYNSYDNLVVLERINLYYSLYIYHSLWGKDGIKNIVEKSLSHIPENVEEAYAYTMLRENYYEDVLQAMPDSIYQSIAEIIDMSYNKEWGFFSFDENNELITMRSIYYGLYLSKIYYQ